MREFCLSRSVEVRRVALDVPVDYGGYEGRGKVGMVPIVGSRYNVDECWKVGRQNRIS